MSVVEFDSESFKKDDLNSLKGDRKVFVVFSTFGEREADLIYSKVKLIKDELGDFVDKVFLSHRRAVDDEVEKTEIMAKKADPEIDMFLCNNQKVPDMGDEQGKGADMRRLLYYIGTGYDNIEDAVVIFLDSDVLTEYFGIHFILGLAGPLLKGFDFSKASFWRKMGRVKKFVAQPLFSSIKHEKLNDLTKFHYPLSGEVAGTYSFFQRVNFWQRYGIETGVNIDSCLNDYKVADVNLGLYDHAHSTDMSIQKMCFGIIRTYLTQLRDYGILELKDGAEISDTFSASYIDEDSKRQSFSNDLKEIKYKPLINIKNIK